MPKVQVNLGERSYDILIDSGLLENSAHVLKPLIGGRRVAVVSDAVVESTHLSRFAPVLDAVADSWKIYRVTGGEAAKSFAGLEALLDDMLADGVDRGCVLVAFGGGVVGDVGGFAASLLMRGIDLVQVPTTLMSQVDSAVGGKNAINTRQGKNLVGSFLQPRLVLNDVSVLKTLPAGELRAGYGEIIKYGLLRGDRQFEWLEANGQALLDGDESALTEAIRMGCETKANVVSEDERDQGKRALVNLGHTFAHAFEAQAGYGQVPHGAAVAVGLIAACELSEVAGLCAPGLAARVRAHVHAVGLPDNLPALSQAVDWQGSALRDHMLHDKKTIGGRITFVLLKAVGEPVVTAEIGESQVMESLGRLGAQV